MKLDAVTVSIDDVRPAERNVRRHPTKQIEALKESYELFGQYRPLVVDSDGVILVGNGMYKALVELGVKNVEVKYLPADFPDDMKKKLMLADNKTQSIGIDDLTTIEEFILELPDFDIPGFEEDILNDLYGESTTIEDYGVLPKERIEKINDRAAETASEGLGEVSAAQYAQQISDMPYKNPEVTEADVHTGDYVTCPNCGMKIWR